jgi:Uma2 family endonuclease
MSELAISNSEEPLEVSSYNHAMVQANLAFLLKSLGQYDVLTELNLDMGDGREMKPEVCICPKRGLRRPRDILRMVDMPLLAIEILSPKQGIDDILEKFELYFKVSVQSC